MSDDDVKAELERLKRENESLLEQAKAKPGQLSLKVSEKGAVSVYGMGRFPVTLYYEQWKRLLAAAPQLQEFLEENKSRLKLKETGE